ncbi:MAG: hypothetical protein EU548_07275 [Promethearchaeota archaeon]|nr:MAG: hypothetical protein EU548_07275 [Candidatus Lokiarchaeota archaeon]
MILGTGYYYYNWSAVGYPIDDNYIFNITVYDSSNNQISTADYYFNITDAVLPTIGTPIWNSAANYSTGVINVNVTVIDNYKLRDYNPVNITFFFPNGTMINKFAMDNVYGNIFNYTWPVGLNPIADNYYFTITAIDNQSNIRTSINRLFKIVDEEIPKIVISYTPTAEYESGELQVNATVSDNFGVDYVEILFFNPNGTQIGVTRTMNYETGDLYTYNESVSNTLVYYVQGPSYYFTIKAYDLAGKTNDTQGNPSYFDIIDTTKPKLGFFNLVNLSYFGEPFSYNFIFNERVTLMYDIGLGSNRTMGTDTDIHSDTINLFDFNALSEGWFNITFWFYDSFNNLGSRTFRFYKDITDPTFQFVPGTNPDGKAFSSDTAPTFYIALTEVNISAVRYKIPSIMENLYQVYSASPSSSDIKSLDLIIRTSDLSNFPVQILASHWKLVEDNKLINIEIWVFDQANNNFSITFAVIKSSADAGPDGEAPDMMMIIIIIVVGAVAAVGIIGFTATRKKKVTPEQIQKQKLAIRAPTPRTKKGKMVDGKLVTAKDVKAKKLKAAEPGAKPLTEAEKAEIERAEAEMEVEKEKHICVVHKGPIKGAIYLCPECSTFYCMKCARTLKMKGEKCWSCEAEIEVEVPEYLKKGLEPTSIDAILEKVAQYDANMKKAIEQEKPFDTVPQLDQIEFNMIDPDILEHLNKVDIDANLKTEIIKDLLTMTPEEQEFMLGSILLPIKEDEDNEQDK